jgi:hypothetical protein
VVYGHWTTTQGPTTTHRRQLEIAATAYAAIEPSMAGLEAELSAITDELEAAGAPWIPGRF